MTDVSLRDYIERRITDLEQQITLRFTLNDEAISKAERTMNDRLNGMNEFRDALKDQAGRMATRIELEALLDQVHDLRRTHANWEGRAAIMAIVASTLISVAFWVLTWVAQ